MEKTNAFTQMQLIFDKYKKDIPKGIKDMWCEAWTLMPTEDIRLAFVQEILRENGWTLEG